MGRYFIEPQFVAALSVPFGCTGTKEAVARSRRRGWRCFSIIGPASIARLAFRKIRSSDDKTLQISIPDIFAFEVKADEITLMKK